MSTPKEHFPGVRAKEHLPGLTAKEHLLGIRTREHLPGVFVPKSGTNRVAVWRNTCKVFSGATTVYHSTVYHVYFYNKDI